MTAYRVELSPRALKDLRRMTDRRLHDRLTEAIATLADNPRPAGCLKLVGAVDQWRVRVGDWRIVYRIEDGRLVVLVVTVAPRGGVYG
ncbi:type II toxin-antitoxin system RelE family toxin [Pseudotabrizicola formosa]|uniref:type II toxin-antitoxin system RelE family toxin n=1 Tax=Pseudotabrizicola formosa TaxID=2030009 RepID=UPI000CD0E0B7|nr:type II toxin-antitoxin system RelE/ParE family toxin [Pseudotabrizicola formosa]